MEKHGKDLVYFKLKKAGKSFETFGK